MSGKDADELNVWFFRATGFSKSHHSCEERKKKNQSCVVHWCLCGCLDSELDLADLLLSIPAPQLAVTTKWTAGSGHCGDGHGGDEMEKWELFLLQTSSI